MNISLKTKSAPSNLQNPYILTKFNSLPLFVKKTLKFWNKNNCTLNSFYLNPITFQHHHFLPKTNLHSVTMKSTYISQPNTHPSLNLIPSLYLLKKP